MIRFLLRRAILIPVALLLVNFLAFAYTIVAWRANAETNPFFAVTLETPPLLTSYWSYFQNLIRLDLGTLPYGRGTILNLFLESSRATLGLLLITFVISTLLGLLLGLGAVKTRPPGAAGWLLPVSTVGLAMPSFFIGSVFIAGMVLYTLKGFGKPPFPFGGFGWDEHLILPVLALMVRPTVQVAQASARLLADELDKPYVVAARSVGHSWQRVRWRTALHNVLAPIILTITGSFRVLLGELILVEWLFGWPGLGRLLAQLLVPPHTTAQMGGSLYLDAPYVATTLTIFAALFLLADFLGSLVVRLIDPRLRSDLGEVVHG
jgi:peptide/nickel transport system permease protein